MKRTVHVTLKELMQDGIEMFEALRKIEDSGEFSENEIQQWFDNFHNKRTQRTKLMCKNSY